MRAPYLLATVMSLAACQPASVEIKYDVDAPLYGSDDDPAGNTGSGGGAGGGDGGAPTDPVVGSLRMAHVSDGGFTGALACEAWWTVAGESASTDCPDCGFTLDWAYSMAYELDEAALSLPAGCEWTTPGYLVGSGAYGDEILGMWLGTWAFSSDYYSGGALLMGYANYGYTYWQPLAGAELSASSSSIEWHFAQVSNYGGYGYYDDYTVGQYWDGYAETQ